MAGFVTPESSEEQQGLDIPSSKMMSITTLKEPSSTDNKNTLSQDIKLNKHSASAEATPEQQLPDD